MFKEVVKVIDDDLNKKWLSKEEFEELQTKLGNPTVNIMSSGKKREFSSGSRRDSAEDKPRMELLPLDLLMDLSEWYSGGAKKYGDNNWLKGQPQSVVIGSMLRHLTKLVRGDTDERHDLAIVWNAIALQSSLKYHKDNKQICDVVGEWYVDGKPTGKGNYEDSIY